MIEKTDNKIVKFPIEITEKEYDALISISGGDVEKNGNRLFKRSGGRSGREEKNKKFQKELSILRQNDNNLYRRSENTFEFYKAGFGVKGGEDEKLSERCFSKF